MLKKVKWNNHDVWAIWSLTLPKLSSEMQEFRSIF